MVGLGVNKRTQKPRERAQRSGQGVIVVSLFDGVGGGLLGLRRACAGIPVAELSSTHGKLTGAQTFVDF